MINKEILSFCLKKGILLDKEVLELFSNYPDLESAKFFIEKIKEVSSVNVLTKHTFIENITHFNKAVEFLPEERKKKLEKLKINLGLSIEIIKEISEPNIQESKIIEEKNDSVRVISNYLSPSKKLTVSDFVTHFRNRFNSLKNILQENSSLTNLTSISKISPERKVFSLIGLISSKKVSKNKNLLLEIEDLTGKITVLINKDKKDLFSLAEDLPLDSVIGFKGTISKGTSNKNIFFVNEIILPESSLSLRKKSPIEEFALFIGDIHIGSKLFLEKNFLKFIDYLNGKVPNTPEVSKIKYLFIVGDLIAGVANYPGQEKELSLSDLESHFQKAAELLSKIRSDIKIIISTGNHDGVRIMEPQPLINEKYAWPLYNLKNISFVTNPSLINFGFSNSFSGFNILLYHGFSFFYYADNIPSLIKQKSAHRPELIMDYLLKYRHLAPTHSSTQYYPSEKDSLLIQEVPDIFISGHTHKSGVMYHNNILIISVSSWESMTGYQEKRGAEPDFCKVPIFNLKTGSIKILDFEQ
ncbi:metallophosphoesterase [Candidatus Pacearchaeota archaeon]|nr:metallophosphoesterase [Candidatus Pacearchaeota archaeon]